MAEFYRSGVSTLFPIASLFLILSFVMVPLIEPEGYFLVMNEADLAIAL